MPDAPASFSAASSAPALPSASARRSIPSLIRLTGGNRVWEESCFLVNFLGLRWPGGNCKAGRRLRARFSGFPSPRIHVFDLSELNLAPLLLPYLIGNILALAPQVRLQRYFPIL